MQDLQLIALDADDTLWDNEPFFRRAEEEFYGLLEDYLPRHSTGRALYATEMRNLPLYGYGIKAFTLSMIETALEVTDGRAPAAIVRRCTEIGRAMLDHPVELLPGVADTLTALGRRYRLVLATKGDLLDQERKLEKSGLAAHFHHIEVMSDKQIPNYRKLLRRLDCPPARFLMVGNSVKSDVLPVIELGGSAVHVPYHVTWEHERVDGAIDHPHFHRIDRLTELPSLLP